MPSNQPAQKGPRLCLNAREAAQALGISERTLWQQTQPRGPIPSVRVGHCVRYSVSALESFASGEAARS